MNETGLSLDDRPIQPVRHNDRWVCPVDGGEVLQLSSGKFVHKPSDAFLAVFNITLEQFLVEQEADG